MIQPSTCSTSSTPSFFFNSDRPRTRVFRHTLPRELHDLTASADEDELLDLENVSDEPIELLEFIHPTGWSESAVAEQTVSNDLHTLYERSGLTWKQLASLIGVSLRMVHFWISGEKRISEEHADIVNHLIRLIAILDLGPSYRTRKFFEDSILPNESILTLLNNKDFLALERWTQEKSFDRRPQPLEVSASFFETRLPENAATLISGQQDTLRPTKKATLARVHRRRK